ncbi:MAG: SDR family oxidoreductase [Acidimicrobiia bacterium]
MGTAFHPPNLSRALSVSRWSRKTTPSTHARFSTPGEIADVAWFLLTPLSSYVTGEVIVVGGGRSLS